MNSPLTTNLTAGLRGESAPTGYPKNWAQISENTRKKYGYICDECGVCCKESPQVLDVHHKDGVKSNCSAKNLRCLCKDCHARQPLHAQYAKIISQEHKDILRRLREEQGIPQP